MQEALATAAIEGEQLNLESLRSSVAHRLQLADAPGPDRSVEGLVQVMQDALANHSAALDLDRLCRWQSALFPGGTSGIVRIAVGRVRDHADAMQIVSGPLGREMVVHYEAPPSAQVAAHMGKFLAWFESTPSPLPLPPQLHGELALHGRRWCTCGLSPSTRLKTATAAWAAPWQTWRWPRTCTRKTTGQPGAGACVRHGPPDAENPCRVLRRPQPCAAPARRCTEATAIDATP
ncbi:MAG: DUF4172 domain-containing protein [Burkholderiales bacterium]|nr:DUF4172 domain-containing protein [Burkholderiales bacterium]